MSAVRAEALEAPRRRSSRAVAPPPRAARSSARPLPQESAGPRARRRIRIRWPSALSLLVLGLVAVGAAGVSLNGERITAQQNADTLDTKIEHARSLQRDLVIELVRAETPAAVAKEAERSGLVEPSVVAAVPAAPLGPLEATVDGGPVSPVNPVPVVEVG
ncbi:MAG: hypothetical protein FJW94_11270 [Actinobacteria bacterium]|nr:hypothetical protein [Actinomycetota bacterium]